MKIGAKLKKLRNNVLFSVSKWSTWIQVLGIPLILLTLCCISNTNGDKFNYSKIDSWWNHWGDPLLGVGTFLVAVVIWLTNMAKDWEDRLPKYFSIRYYLIKDGSVAEKPIIECQYATLPHESDIRNFGQTLGAQTTHNPQTRFSYGRHLQIASPTTEKNHHKLNIGFHRHWDVTFFLRDLPKALVDNTYYLWEAGKDEPNKPINNLKPDEL